MDKTLYNLTAQQAKTLVEHCNNDIGALAIVLWNYGKAKSMERGIYKAKKLVKFSKEAI